MTLWISSPYWVVRLGKDYEYSVVTQPGYQNLWILYRKSEMPDQLYHTLVEDLKKDGYPVERIVKTPQNV
jgi:apolipoprotein D and lipocalin family protein